MKGCYIDTGSRFLKEADPVKVFRRNSYMLSGGTKLEYKKCGEKNEQKNNTIERTGNGAG